MKFAHPIVYEQVEKHGLINHVKKFPLSIVEIEEVGRELQIDTETINEAIRIQKARIGESLQKIIDCWENEEQSK